MNHQFLPVSKEDLKQRGIDRLDFVYITGDAYVDHPSFGPSIIGRLLESRGYTVGILAQPDWKDRESITALGRPRLGFLVSAGNMDSMVNHYSVSKKHRQTDSYTPGGVMGKRPDYAVVVYTNLIRQVYKDVPVIVGGIEASLRRLAHYDYWSDRVKRSVLMDGGADLISYGMGEHSIVEIADALASGINVKDITFVDGTCYKTKDLESVYDYILLPSYEEIRENKQSYAKSFAIQYKNTDPFSGKRLVEPYGTVYVVQNPPAKPLTRQEMDDIYALPYCRTWHPMYDAAGGIPAIAEVKFSLVSNRGCFGGCNFCALTMHQGRIVQTRSHESILAEAVEMTKDPEFKGYIHDVGGPTADFRHPSCDKQLTKGVCQNRQCLFPTPCPNLKADHQDYVELLRKLRKLPKVKKVFIRSGIRFDYLMADQSDTFFRELVQYHVSGQLKVAPEHCSSHVLACMGKPDVSVYDKFREKYAKLNEEYGLNQYLVPYLMSSHPGSTMDDAALLAAYTKRIGLAPEQVQDFYPTPGTASTVMYYTGLDPFTGKEIYTATNYREKQLQRALLQWRKPENRRMIYEAMNYCSEEGKENLRELLHSAKPAHTGKPNNPAKAKAKTSAKSEDSAKSSSESKSSVSPKKYSSSKNQRKPYAKDSAKSFGKKKK